MKPFVAVLMMLALSGVANASIEAATHGLATAQESATKDSANDEAKDVDCADCDEGCDGPCSPLCSDCVCSFGARSMPSAPPLFSAPPMVGTIEAPIAVSAAPPRAPEMGDVFHPPRS